MSGPREPEVEGDGTAAGREQLAPGWRSRLSRAVFYGASSAVILWAAWIVPLPFVEFVPGTPTPIPPLVQIEGADTSELDGDTALLTVILRQQPTAQALGALLDEQRTLEPATQVYPPGVDRDEQLELQRERFGRQFDVAAAVGAQAAGVETELVTEVVVVQVLPESPAEGLLAPGDVVEAVDGEEIVAAEELQDLTRRAEIGDELTLTVRHAGNTREVTARLADVADDGQARLGVAIETAVNELRLPFDVTLSEGVRIGGPSAGMMVGLTVYDLLSDEDLLAGRTVVGTGTLDADGRIGPVGGVREKMRAAADYDADLVLVPSLQLDEAHAGAPEDLEVVGVADIDEALDVLRGSP